MCAPHEADVFVALLVKERWLPNDGLNAVADRITGYLCLGGFFNPELMDHEKVRVLLMDCRDELWRLAQKPE